MPRSAATLRRHKAATGGRGPAGAQEASMIQSTPALALVAITVALVTPLDATAQAVIGGSNVARGGTMSVEFGSSTGNFRNHVAATFPGAQYASSLALT